MKISAKKKKAGIPVIHFKNISLIYDYIEGKRAVDINELRILPGENVVILGPNGSGKSSFINLIIRKRYPELKKEPVIFDIFGREDWHIFELKSHMGIISPELQFAFLNSELGEISVFDNILSGYFSSIGIWREDVTPAMKQKAAATLEFLGISHLKERAMSAVSTGEARLALIARALAHEPDTLLLDEPTSGLDMKASDCFRKILSKIAKRGTSIILVTHNLEDIIPEIKRAVLFKEGRIFRDGQLENTLNTKNLSRLYDARIKLIKTGRGYRADVI